jgi:PKD repeat protein
MQVLACPLIVALSVLVSCFLNPRGATGQTSVARAQATGVVRVYRGQGKQRALKQSPRIVNIRPRVTAAQPGIPTVKVTVDRNRVPLGDEVTFTLTPASVVLDPRYIVTIYFGDGTSQRVRQNPIVYTYSAPGTYTYSILVNLANPPAPDIPRVSLSAYPTPVATESPVTFTAQPSHGYPNIRYRFAFGDGNETQWQDTPQTTHAYKFAGRYLAFVDIGAVSPGNIKPLGGSVRQPIEVISPPVRPIVVTLSANPRSVVVKQPATFVARVNSSEPNIRYRFHFGDRSASTAWQLSPQTTHVYSVRGTYPARVDVQVINSRSAPQTASSNPLSIEVKAAAPKATPSTRARGTSSPAPTPTPSETPTPTPSPTATPTPVRGSSNNWWKYLLALLILLAGYQGWKYLNAPRPTLVPNADPGSSQLGGEGGPLAINFQMELNPNANDGQVAVNTDGGSLIKSERKSDA